eukprot:2767012-Pyramimonas_sp.AAC.1
MRLLEQIPGCQHVKSLRSMSSLLPLPSSLLRRLSDASQTLLRRLSEASQGAYQGASQGASQTPL